LTISSEKLRDTKVRRDQWYTPLIVRHTTRQLMRPVRAPVGQLKLSDDTPRHCPIVTLVLGPGAIKASAVMSCITHTI